MDETGGSSPDLLILLSRTIRFASDHPYAAVGIFGAAVGSVATYKAMTFGSLRSTVNNVFTPKVYEIVISNEDLQRMLIDPTVEMRWEMTDVSVIVTPEKRERPKALPDINLDPNLGE